MKNRTVYSRNNKLNCETEVRAAIYCRLSKDDNLDSESESIQNQPKAADRLLYGAGMENRLVLRRRRNFRSENGYATGTTADA